MFSCLSALISQFKQKQFYEILNDLHKTHFDVEQQVIQLEISAELYVPRYMYWDHLILDKMYLKYVIYSFKLKVLELCYQY